jgi:glycosyltransferase involved in cell wall biosynthesis
MPCPTLRDLPSPSPGQTGWPWTEESAPTLPPTMPDGQPWPRITIVTPSFNQGDFVEATLRSVLLQGYPDLEYLVLDGGSTDGSVEIIKKYAPWLSYWVSEPDGGQSAAIDRGLRRSSGVFATWINSDDMLCRDALVTHASRVGFNPKVVYAGYCLHIDAKERLLQTHRGRIHSIEDLLRVRTVWYARGQRGHLVQPEVLFPRQLALNVGGINPDNHRTMDYELWGRLLLAGVRFEYTDIPVGIFRHHEQQKTHDGWRTTQSLIATATRLLALAEDLPHHTRREILVDLRAYERECWRRTGRLARLRLPRRVVMRLRTLSATLHRAAFADR